MVHVSESETDNWQHLEEQILHEVKTDTEKGLQAGAKLIPRFIQFNFDKGGARGGNQLWKRLTLGSIQWRKTFPHQQSEAIRLAYFRDHKPLIDTGALYKSFAELPLEREGGIMSIEITSPLPYGPGQDDGTAKTPSGGPVWQRPFMFIVLGEDTDKINKSFEGAWSE